MPEQKGDDIKRLSNKAKAESNDEILPGYPTIEDFTKVRYIDFVNIINDGLFLGGL